MESVCENAVGPRIVPGAQSWWAAIWFLVVQIALQRSCDRQTAFLAAMIAVNPNKRAAMAWISFGVPMIAITRLILQVSRSQLKRNLTALMCTWRQWSRASNQDTCTTGSLALAVTP